LANPERSGLVDMKPEYAAGGIDLGGNRTGARVYLRDAAAGRLRRGRQGHHAEQSGCRQELAPVGAKNPGNPHVCKHWDLFYCGPSPTVEFGGRHKGFSVV